jgi:hypothetical protein
VKIFKQLFNKKSISIQNLERTQKFKHQTNTYWNEWIGKWILHRVLRRGEMANNDIRKIFKILRHIGEAYHYYTEINFTLVTTAIIQKTKSNKCFWGYGKRSPNITLLGILTSVIHILSLVFSTSAIHTIFLGMSTRVHHTLLWKMQKECHCYGVQYRTSPKNVQQKKLKRAVSNNTALWL